MNVKVFNLIPGVSKRRVLVEHESCQWKCGLNESVCNSRIIMKVCVSAKNELICVFVKMTRDCECNKAWKVDEYLDIKNWSCEKRQISKFLSEYEDEILDTTEFLLNDKKVAYAKSNCLVDAI